MKKNVLIAGLVCGSMLLLSPADEAGPETADGAARRRTPDEAIEKGLGFLARSQAPNGSIGDGTPAVTSLAIMAFLASGYTPGLPPYGDVINRGIDSVLSASAPSGTLIGSGGRMYSHNIATLMLSEVSGMVDPQRQALIDAVLPRAIEVILAAQDVPKPEEHQGGWRYEPNSGDSDISHSGWALMALRSARNNGAPVPKEAIERAHKYILQCMTPEGFFAYQPEGGRSRNDAPLAFSVARTGIGLLCLELGGRHRDAAARRAVQYIADRFRLSDPLAGEYRYYALYYSANGMYQFGGKEWEEFAPKLFNEAMRFQSADGSWPALDQEKSPQYCTSMAILAMSVLYGQIPIYQR